MRELRATLIQEELVQDELGQYIGTEERRRPVFVRVQSVSRAEWAAAGQRGLRPQLQLSLFASDYRGESLVELEGRRYSVYRSYLPKGGHGPVHSLPGAGHVTALQHWPLANVPGQRCPSGRLYRPGTLTSVNV